MNSNNALIYKKIIKRILDFTLSLIGLAVMAIPMIIISVAIKIDSPGPVVFKQKRLGKKREIFTVYKFRTMCDHAYEIGGLVKGDGDSRITKVGALLRRTSLDELPQLINIIKGEMAIIGPRPILSWEFDNYSNNRVYNKRYKVLPGLFCSVDIDYRASATRELQFKMDADYADHISFLNDINLLRKIVKTVVLGKNVYKEY